MDTIIKYLKETKAELKEVVFPSTSQTITYTSIVIFIYLLDYSKKSSNKVLGGKTSFCNSM